MKQDQKKKLTLSRNLPLALQVALIAHNNDGETIAILDAQDLLLEHLDLLERLPRRDAVHEQEALARAHVLFPHRAVLFLPGGVEHVEQGDLFVDDALFAVGIWLPGAGGGVRGWMESGGGWGRDRGMRGEEEGGGYTFDCGIVFVDKVRLD